LDKATTITADLDDRLRSVEQRIGELAKVFDSLVDIRAAAEQPILSVDQSLVVLQALTAQMRAREASPQWDAIDQLNARIMLQVLSHVATELRRALNLGATGFESARKALQDAKRALDSLQGELSPSGDAATKLG